VIGRGHMEKRGARRVRFVNGIAVISPCESFVLWPTQALGDGAWGHGRRGHVTVAAAGIVYRTRRSRRPAMTDLERAPAEPWPLPRRGHARAAHPRTAERQIRTRTIPMGVKELTLVARGLPADADVCHWARPTCGCGLKFQIQVRSSNAPTVIASTWLHFDRAPMRDNNQRACFCYQPAMSEPCVRLWHALLGGNVLSRACHLSQLRVASQH